MRAQAKCYEFLTIQFFRKFILTESGFKFVYFKITLEQTAREMMYFMSFSALVIFSLQQTRAQDFTLTGKNVNVLQKLEERLLPTLDEFITNKEEHLKELQRMISQMETVKTLSSDSVEGYLGTPLNQYLTIKRFIDDWGTLTELLDSDSSSNGEFVTVFESTCNARGK